MTRDPSDAESNRPSAWEDGGWTSLSHLSGVVRSDVCVVGLGSSGLSALHALLDRGASVVGIDATQLAGGAAGANGGFLLAGTARFYHHTVAAIGRERARELYRLTCDEIERMSADMPDLVRRVGSLRIAMSADELADCESQLNSMRQDDLPVDRYTGPEGQGLLFATDAVFNPLARCRRLAQQCMQRGARLYEHSAALDIQAGCVRTEHGAVRCRHVIVAIDGKLESVFPELQGRVRTARLQMLATAPTSEVSIERAVYARYGFEYWQQLPDGRITLGGFRDHALEPEWTHSTETTELIQDRLTRFLREHIRVSAPITHRWAASVGYTSSGLPIVEQVRPGVWAMGGYNGTGNVIGSLCGRAVADAIAGRSNSLIKLLADDGN